MRSAMLKDQIRLIRRSLRRFFAILLIVGLGVAFYTGIRSASPDMQKTLDAYFDDCGAADIKLISPLGFDESAVGAVRDTAGVTAVQPAYAVDAQATVGAKGALISFQSVEADASINRPVLVDGRYPLKETECLLDEHLFIFDGVMIGDTVMITDEGDDVQAFLKNKRFTVCGIVRSVEYISIERGSTPKGKGALDGFILLPIKNFSMPVYTHVYVRGDLQGLPRFSPEYRDAAAALSGDIQKNAPGPAVWYPLDWSQNIGFETYRQNTGRVNAIGLVFPLIFFLVAALVSLTTMTRLVEENRTNIGLYKALGHGRLVIASKYLLYAGAAAVFGIALGIAAGSQIFPLFIYNAYRILYALPDTLLTPVDIPSAAQAGVSAFICAVLPAFLVCQRQLFAPPAALLRPRAPQPGKRIFLERLPFFWRRLNFSQKITCRNVFRYKKRLLMTVFGVAGCTALVLTGFGLKDAIRDVMDNQFGRVQHYDITVQFRPGGDEAEIFDMLKRDSHIAASVPVFQMKVDVVHDAAVCEAAVFVFTGQHGPGDFISLQDRTTGQPIPLIDGRAVMTEKLMDKLGVKEGESVMLRGTDQPVTVSAPAENYFQDRVYLTPALYETVYGETPRANTVLARIENVSKQAEDSISEALMACRSVEAVSFVSDLKESFNDMLGSLDAVVLVLIVSAAALALIVLFSLTNINIEERRQEMAALKVLGFHDGETAMYLYRENIILTLIGIACGLVLGIFLCRFVIVTAEVDIVMFGRKIHGTAFAVAALITVFFTALANLLTFPIVKNINMVESMKSGE
ncbi:MAG: FtsX-like permease family protein [Oscillospiraceae bacterium]|nr:FtsX-like permease family protein [Oscillospiraceae bacterium]